MDTGKTQRGAESVPAVTGKVGEGRCAPTRGSSVPALRKLVNEALDRTLPSPEQEPRDVQAAMRHAVLGGGHRWRPILLLQSGAVYGCEHEKLMPAAVAVELLHGASVILDDLPCMDAASTRRGKPACHVAFGEAPTVLASHKLVMLALDLLEKYGPRVPLAAMARKAVCGMVAGQSADLRSSPMARSCPDAVDLLVRNHVAKTGTLFRFAVRAGALLAEAPTNDLDALDAFACDVALAYQYLDDVSDADGTALEQGKPAGLDVGRLSAVSVYGLEGARNQARTLMERAVEHLESIRTPTRALREIAAIVCTPGKPRIP